YGPLLLAGIFAAPIAQLENLLLVNREITARLQQLQQIMKPHLAEGQNLLKAGTSPSSGRLHWKLAALSELQSELSSLYTFHQTLLKHARRPCSLWRGR